MSGGSAAIYLDRFARTIFYPFELKISIPFNPI